MAGRGGKRRVKPPAEEWEPRPASGLPARGDVATGKWEQFTAGEGGTGKAMVERQIAQKRMAREQAHQAWMQSWADSAVDLVEVQKRIVRAGRVGAEVLDEQELKQLVAANNAAEKVLDRFAGKATQVVTSEDGSETVADKARKWAQKRGAADGSAGH